MAGGSLSHPRLLSTLGALGGRPSHYLLARPGRELLPGAGRLWQELPEHVLEDPVVEEVLGLPRRVDAHSHLELALAGAHGRLAWQPAGAGGCP